MGQIVQYSNIRQQNLNRDGEISVSDDGLGVQGAADYKRDELFNRYGWQSPSEYYYGIEDSDIGSKTSNMTPSIAEISDFAVDEELGNGPADRSLIPDWFWVDSLDNWCYFKVTDDMTEFKKTSPRFGKYGNEFLMFLTRGWIKVVDDIQKGNWSDALVHTFKSLNIHVSTINETKTITSGVNNFVQSIIGGITEALFGTSIFTKSLTVLNELCMIVAMKMLTASADVYDRTGDLSLPFLLYSLFLTASSVSSEDVESEPYPETLASGNDQNNMPRNCISLYMWNGYKRNWMPLKRMIEIYERYGKRGSRDLLYSSFKNVAHKMRSANNELYGLYLETFGLIVESGDPTIDSLKQSAYAIRDIANDDEDFCRRMTDLFIEYPQFTDALTRSLFMDIYCFDPACIESMQLRSPLNKAQTIRVNNNDNSSWSQKHWLENWSMWIPLQRDRAKIRLYNRDTYQLINRPFSVMDWFNRDLVGFEHKNIGHPCFMRGNDDLLWMCYWQRWTSTRGDEKEGGSVLDKTITVPGVQDIYKSDIENWTSIRESMFDKHDDYGFDDWMINGNYLLTNHRFTIDEETPSEVSSYEESSIAPDKVAPVNSIDEVPDNEITLTLSTGTVVSRDDDNGFTVVAKRWK